MNRQVTLAGIMTVLFASGMWLVLAVGGVWSLAVAIKPVVASCGCGNSIWLPASGRLWPSLILLGGAIFVAVRFILNMVAHWRAERTMERDFMLRGVVWVEHHPLRRQVGVVSSPELFAVTIGSLIPRIYLSRAMIQALSKREVAAVLRHEAAHADRHHPRWTVIYSAITATFGWFPWIRRWVTVARTDQELAADAFASDNYRSVGSLASALVKLQTAPVTIGVAWTTLDVRIDYLLQSHQHESIRGQYGWTILIALIVVGSAMAAGVFAVRSATARSPQLLWCTETRLACPGRAPIQTTAPVLRSSYVQP